MENRRVVRMVLLVSIAFCALLALVGYVGAVTAPAETHEPAHTSSQSDWPQCRVEDGSTQDHCRWDGGANHTGRAFLTWEHGTHGYYLDNGESW